MAALYPDIKRAGNLREAMQCALNDSGTDLVAAVHPAPEWRSTATVVESATRTSDTHLARRQRLFNIEFSERGVCMASGSTTELATCVGPVVAWQAGADLEQLCAAAPFIRPTALGLAFEQGTAVEFIWNQFLESEYHDPALLEAAYAQPALRALRPYTSMNALHFSRSTRFPFTTDLPFVIPRDEGGYRVVWQIESSSMDSWWLDLQRVDRDFVNAETVADAIAVVLEHLPDGCGPAIDGTARDLDKPNAISGETHVPADHDVSKQAEPVRE